MFVSFLILCSKTSYFRSNMSRFENSLDILKYLLGYTTLWWTESESDFSIALQFMHNRYTNTYHTKMLQTINLIVWSLYV